MVPRHATAGGRRVLVTGIAGALAGLLAARLEADGDVTHIVGVDEHGPPPGLVRTEFVRGALRNPLLANLIESARIDTVVHLALTAMPRGAGGRERMKEHNVLGTLHLLAAAQAAPSVRTVVMKSTTAVYGSDYADPALFREDATPGGIRQYGYGKDAVEAEGYASVFARRRPDVATTVLRFASLVGPTVDTPLTRYFALPVVPTLLGFDPRLQLCHETDALEVLARAVGGDRSGTFNVAGPGVVYLSQAIRLAGRVPLPVLLPFANGLAGLARRSGRVDFSPDQLRLLLYGRVADITRLREDFGYEPAYSTRAALADFCASGRATPLVDPAMLRRAEQRLQERLARLRPAATASPDDRRRDPRGDRRAVRRAGARGAR